MVTRKQSIENFSLKMDELIACKYILTAKKITEVLKAITSSRLFFELVLFCNEGYDYPTERARFYQSCEPFVFDDNKSLIAFAINLLTAIDSREEDLLTILSKNYRGENFDRAYKQFANEFLKPFKDAMIASATAMIEGCCHQEASPVCETCKENASNTDAKRVEQAAKVEMKKHYGACYEDLQQSIINERNAIMASRISDLEKADLFVLLEAFKECVFMGNRDQIRTSFISYKYAAINFKKLNSCVDEMERILKFCKVI